MKNFFLIVLIAFFFSCETPSDVTPELSSRVEGTYKATKLTSDGTILSLENVELLIVLEKSSPETVNGIMKLKLNGASEPDDSIGTLLLKDAGSAGVDLYGGNLKVGNVSKSNQLTVAVISDGTAVKVLAEKRRQ